MPVKLNENQQFIFSAISHLFVAVEFMALILMFASKDDIKIIKFGVMYLVTCTVAAFTLNWIGFVFKKSNSMDKT